VKTVILSRSWQFLAIYYKALFSWP